MTKHTAIDKIRNILAGCDDHEMAAVTRATLAAAAKTITVEVATDDLTFLKKNGYKLCFAKKVAEGTFNVVWQSYTDYLVTNEFSWTPQYQLFGSNTFRATVTVKVATNKMTIGLGETSLLTSAGVIEPPSTGGPSTGITMTNEFGPIHPGLNQLSIGLNGESVSTPFYVAENQIALGETTMTPVEKILIWFEQNVETSTMFATARSNSVEVDMTTTNSATRLYKGGKWSTP